MNLRSLSEIILDEIPCNFTIILIQSSASFCNEKLILIKMKCTALVSLSTITQNRIPLSRSTRQTSHKICRDTISLPFKNIQRLHQSKQLLMLNLYLMASQTCTHKSCKISLHPWSPKHLLEILAAAATEVRVVREFSRVFRSFCHFSSSKVFSLTSV